MIAAIQMYDWPEFHAANDAFWTRVAQALNDHGIAAPSSLSRPADLYAPWPDPALVLGQTCGLPYVAGRCGAAILVGRPDYGLPGASGGTYHSVLVARHNAADDIAGFRGLVAAINDWGSQSGCNALADAALTASGALPFFSDVVQSGGHRTSTEMVADGHADIAAIDAVSWAMFQRVDPDRAARLKSVGHTRTTSALPFITAAAFKDSRQIILSALKEACTPPSDVPGLPVAMVSVTDDDYDATRAMARRIHGQRLAPGQPMLGHS